MLKEISVNKEWRNNGFSRNLKLTRHVTSLNLSHEGEDVPGGVLSTENMVLPLLDGREMRLRGRALQEVAEVLVENIFGTS